MSLDLLRAAAQVAGPGHPGLPEGWLRFSLEFAEVPDLEALRAHISTLVAGGAFELRPLPSGDDPHILLLEFPGVSRRQSASFLFDTAYVLADELNAISCTPDIDPGWRDGDELGRDAPESVRGVVRRFCESQAVPPADRLWPVEMTRAREAWARFSARGEGILVGQPDTGVADHRELDGGLDVSRGVDVLAGGGPPIDPLTAKDGNPGHGTATASCVISRERGQISGIAPDALVVPLRCTNVVVLGSGAAVATAIDHARQQGCHVVTMSLGGPLEFADLRRAIQRAVDSGMIVLAAAGNCVRFVVYPAWDPNVIAVAGVDQHDRRWKGSCRGAAVDVAAPAEHVYVARRSGPDDLDTTIVHPGQGTSFAVAITAGCAALWLSHHTPAGVKDAASARGTTVQSLFRAALRQTARTPEGWPENLGAGIVNAEALLELPLDQIRSESSAPNGHPAIELADRIDWPRYASEAGYLALDRAQRADPVRAAALESPVAPRTSDALRRALDQSGTSPAAVFGSAPPVVIPMTPEMGYGRALRILATPRRSGATVESEGPQTEKAARSVLEGDGGKLVLEQFARTMDAIEAREGADTGIRELRQTVREAAPLAVRALVAGARPQDLAGVSRVAVEALIRMSGRPALRVVDGMIDREDPEAGDWLMTLYGPRLQLKPLIDAVGRIDLEYGGDTLHIGTGTVVAPGVVMTNRHVLDAIAEPIPVAGGERFIFSGEVSIAFDETASDAARRFSVTGVLAAGADRIGSYADVAKLDMALLTIETTNSSGQTAPPPAPMVTMESSEQPQLLVVGYPARPGSGALVDPSTGQVSADIIDRLFAIYQNRYGEKYVSPGEVDLSPGSVSGDARGWAFSHDATTLAGNSGSCVIDLSSNRICGLHFAGATLRQNLAHSVSAVREAGVLKDEVFRSMGWPNR